jgi:hypothetical protein
MATFYKFGKLWEIPPAAARLGKTLPANTQAFETFLINLEPMLSNFITAHPRCPKDPDLPAVRYAIKQFMEEQAPSNFFKERWAASYDPARKVTYVSWFLGTIAYFLDKLDANDCSRMPRSITTFPCSRSGTTIGIDRGLHCWPSGASRTCRSSIDSLTWRSAPKRRASAGWTPDAGQSAS